MVVAERGQEVLWGDPSSSASPRGLAFRAKHVDISEWEDTIQRIQAGPEIDRPARRGFAPYEMADFSGGILVDRTIRDLRDLNKAWFNQGAQLRYPAVACLPELVINEASLTNDENVSGFNAAKKWRWDLVSTVGGGPKWYSAVGQRLYNANATTGALGAAKSCNVDGAGASPTLPGVVTCAGELEVGGAKVAALALRNYGIVTTPDLTASPVIFTTVVDGGSSCYINTMRFLLTLGGGQNVVTGKINGINGSWGWKGTETAPVTPYQVFDADTIDVEAAQGPLMVTAARFGVTSSDTSNGGTAITNPTNCDADDGNDATWTGTVKSAYASTLYDFTADGIPDGALIEGYRLEFQAKDTISVGGFRVLEAHLLLNGVQVGLSRCDHTPTAAIASDTVHVIGGLTDAWGARLTGADVKSGTLRTRISFGATSSLDMGLDYIKLQIAYRETGTPRTWVGPLRPTVFTTETGGPTVSYSSPENVFADDGTAALNAGSTVTGDLWGGFVNEGVIPDNVDIEEVVFQMKVKQEAAATNASDAVVQLWLDGALIGVSKHAIHSNMEWGAGIADEYQYRYYRFPQGIDPVATTLITPANISRLMLNWETAVGTTADDRSIDLLAMYVSYRDRRGTMTSLPTGAKMLEHNPVWPNRVRLAAPPEDEETTALLPLELWYIDYAWNAEIERVVQRLQQPPENMRHVQSGCALFDGLLIAGGDTVGLGTKLSIIDGSNDNFPIPFPERWGPSGQWTPRINNLISHNLTHAELEVVMYDSNNAVVDLQRWFLDGNRRILHADTPLTSITDHPSSGNMSISAAPITAGIALVNPETQYSYAFFPNSTDMAVRREHVHANLAANPMLDNPTWLKQMAFASGTENTGLYFQTPELAFGLPDARNSLQILLYNGRQVSNNGSGFGIVTASLNTAGDPGFSATALTNAFNAAFELYRPAGGVTYRTAIWRLSLQHSANSAETPNAVPFTFTAAQKYAETLKVWDFYVDIPEIPDGDFLAFLDAIDALEAANLTQRLRFGNEDKLAICEGWVKGIPRVVVPPMGEPLSEVRFIDRNGEQAPAVLRYRQSPGSVT